MKTLRILFFAVFALQLTSIYFELQVLRLVTKPLICLVLFLTVYQSNIQVKRIVLSALVACFLGDVFLMIPNTDSFFIFGLASFLIGHIFYCLAFYKMNPNIRKSLLILLVSALVVGFYVMYISGILLPSVGELQIPVFVYMCIIGLMTILATTFFTFHSKDVAITVVSGAILFVCSDTILALNHFVNPIENGHFWVMITYMLAQYFIITGILNIKKETR